MGGRGTATTDRQAKKGEAGTGKSSVPISISALGSVPNAGTEIMAEVGSGPTDLSKRSVEEYESSIAAAAIEFAALYGADGTFRKDFSGSAGKVEISAVLKDYEKGSVFTHNHPNNEKGHGGSFSPDDLHAFNYLSPVGEMRAVAVETVNGVQHKVTYSLRRTDPGKRHNKATQSARNAIVQEFSNDVKALRTRVSGIQDPGRRTSEWQAGLHDAAEKVSQKLGYHYTRTMVKVK